VDVNLDNDWRIGYLVDDETFEAEEFFEAFNSQDAILENRNNEFFELNHCNN